jgi:F-type H+/Na+-transporting ATPase subunit alpha
LKIENLLTMKDFKYYLNTISEVGFVEEASSSIVHVSGLPNVKTDEIVIFETGKTGMVLSLTSQIAEILVFSKEPINHGTKVARTNELLKVPVGKELFGRIINPLGDPLTAMDSYKKPTESLEVNALATGILSRKTITRQLETGIPIVDLVMPLGFGQRELIIGDRKTGKSNFIMQTILNQAKQKHICIYAAIGKKRLDIKDAEEFFKKHKIMDQIIFVATGFDDPIGLSYLVPFSAMTIGEYFRDQGYDVLVVLDDLTTHAKFYREISLLGKKFPGRNSYPGDIFYLHARLLERAGNFTTKNGEKAITCLPVVETAQGDLSGYIQTNIMSMTDGHLYFDSDLFAKGRRPAINPFLSVTRVGRQTQSTLKRSINREILSFLTVSEKMQNFSHFGAELTEASKVTLAVGEKVIKFLDQGPSTTMPINLQILLFSMLWNNILQNKNIEPIGEDVSKMIDTYNTKPEVSKVIDQAITESETFNDMLRIMREREAQLMTLLKA